jgi:HK97 family phage major capsid protein
VLSPVQIGAVKAVALPWIYDHTLADLPLPVATYGDMRDYLVGTVETAKADDIGLWIEAELKRHDEWATAVMEMVDRGALAWSSGSAPHLVSKSASGWIKTWPVIEWSSTPTPAEPRHTGIEQVKHFVNDQDPAAGRPPAQPDQGARPPGVIPAVLSHDTQEQRIMTLTVNGITKRAIVWAIAETNLDQLQGALAAVKQGGDGNAIAELVRPMAEELATLAGATPEETQAYLIEFVAQHATSQTPDDEPAEEPALPEPAGGGGAMMSAETQKAIDSAVSKAFQAQLPQHPTGAYLTPQQKNVRVIAPAKTFTWVKAIRAMSNRDGVALKAMGINPDTAGGYLVAPEYSNEVIELLRSGAPVLALCKRMPMPTDTTYVPKVTGGSSVVWLGENASITPGDLTFGQVSLVAKKAAALLQISNELLADGGPEVEALLRADLAAALAEAADNAILEGAGVNGEPQGLSVHPDITKTALNAVPTFANLLAVQQRLEVENVKADPAWTWVFHPREKSVLAAIQDSTSGDYLWTEMGLPGHTMVGGYPATLRGFPYVTTTQITIDTVNNSETKVYFGQWQDVIVGIRSTLELMASNVAGTAFQADQTWIRAIMRMDVNIRHAESMEILTDVRAS